MYKILRQLDKVDVVRIFLLTGESCDIVSKYSVDFKKDVMRKQKFFQKVVNLWNSLFQGAENKI